jgi:hypothetical protein
MKTLSRFLLIMISSLVGQQAAQAQQAPLERCPAQYSNVDARRLAYLQTKFMRQLEVHASQTGTIALAGYGKWAAMLRPVRRQPMSGRDRICRELPQLCKLGNDELCAANPGACADEAKSTAPATFDDALEIAQARARLVVAQVTPLGTRAGLLARVSADQGLSGLPAAVRQQISDHALALELKSEGERLVEEFHDSLYHESCTDFFLLNYPIRVGQPPTAATMNTQLRDAANGLSGFALPVPGQVTHVNLTGNMAARAAFFEGFKPRYEGAVGVVNALFGLTDAVRFELRQADIEVIAAGRGMPPVSGHHFRIEWALSPLFMTHLNAIAAKNEMTIDHEAIKDGIDFLKSGLTQFAPGGGGGPVIPIQGACGTSDGLSTDFPTAFDAQGRIGSFMQAQAAAGMLRGDAQLIIEAVVICAMGWVRQTADDLRTRNFVLDTSFDVERSTASVLLQRMGVRKDNYHARAQAALARDEEIDQVVP